MSNWIQLDAHDILREGDVVTTGDLEDLELREGSLVSLKYSAGELVEVYMRLGYWGFRKVDTEPEPEPEPEEKTAFDPYNVQWRGGKLDPMRVVDLFQVTEMGVSQAIKKLLRLGGKHKTKRKDLEEAITSLQRTIEMMDEDEQEKI